MTQPIDTSPAALCKLYDEYLGDYENTKVMRDTLFAVAAEKEAQARQEPVAWATKSGIARFVESGVGALTAYKKHCTPAKECQSVPLYLAPQPHPEQPLEMVAPADVPLPEPDEALDFVPNAKVYHAPLVQKLVNEAAHQYAEAYAKAAVAAERERCVHLVETQNTYGDPAGPWLEVLAAKIRTPAAQPKLKGDSNG